MWHRCWLQQVFVKLYKITRFTIFVSGGWGRVNVKFGMFEGGGYQNQTSTNKGRGGGRSTFWLFCDNVILECLLNSFFYRYLYSKSFLAFFGSSVFKSIYVFNHSFWLALINLWTFDFNPFVRCCFQFLMHATHMFLYHLNCK